MTQAPRLPAPATVHSPDSHRAMALRFLTHAGSQLRRGHRLQASEKVWGAVAHQLKAIAEQRGWQHDGHANFYDIASYLAKEYGQRDLVARVASVDQAQHRNYYKNNLLPRDIEAGLDVAKELVADLETLRQSPPRPYTISDKHDSDLVKRLSGDRYPTGTTSSDAFTNPDRLAERTTLWGRRPHPTSSHHRPSTLTTEYRQTGSGGCGFLPAVGMTLGGGRNDRSWAAGMK